MRGVVDVGGQLQETMDSRRVVIGGIDGNVSGREDRVRLQTRVTQQAVNGIGEEVHRGPRQEVGFTDAVHVHKVDVDLARWLRGGIQPQRAEQAVERVAVVGADVRARFGKAVAEGGVADAAEVSLVGVKKLLVIEKGVGTLGARPGATGVVAGTVKQRRGIGGQRSIPVLIQQIGHEEEGVSPEDLTGLGEVGVRTVVAVADQRQGVAKSRAGAGGDGVGRQQRDAVVVRVGDGGTPIVRVQVFQCGGEIEFPSAQALVTQKAFRRRADLLGLVMGKV